MSEIATQSQPSVTGPTYPVQPYAVDGGATLSGVTMLFSGLVIVGALVGVAVHYISQAFYLIIVFPFLIGLLLGTVGNKMVRAGRVRNPLIGGLAGLVGGIVAMVMVQYFDYRDFDAALEKMPNIRALAQRPQSEREQIIRESDKPDDLRLALEVGAVNSFPAYVDYAARQGVSISNHGSSGINLGYYGTYIYWLVELGIVAGLTFAMVRAQTREPFCATCMAWKKVENLGRVRGSPPEIALAVGGGAMTPLLSAANPRIPMSDLELSIATCEHCKDSSTDVKLEKLVPKPKGGEDRKIIVQNCWPNEAADTLRAAFKSPPPAPSAVAAEPVASELPKKPLPDWMK